MSPAGSRLRRPDPFDQEQETATAQEQGTGAAQQEQGTAVAQQEPRNTAAQERVHAAAQAQQVPAAKGQETGEAQEMLRGRAGGRKLWVRLCISGCCCL